MKMQKGFTLVGLMIVVATIAILPVVALPAYSNYAIRGNIPAATKNLPSLRVSMDQHYQGNRIYLNGTACGVAMPATPAMQYFVLTCPNSTATTDTINQINTKQTTAAPAVWSAAAMPANFWITSQGGSC